MAPAYQTHAARMAWEHAVPAENFGRAFKAWREGAPVCVDRKGKPFKGRNCARKASRPFRLLEAGMYNVFPAVGVLHAVRGNRPDAAFPGIPPCFGTCQAKVKGTRFEPPQQTRGELARAALYMEQEYPECRLSRPQRQLFEVWNIPDPVEAWECPRITGIEGLQGNGNTVVKRGCAEAGLW